MMRSKSSEKVKFEEKLAADKEKMNNKKRM